MPDVLPIDVIQTMIRQSLLLRDAEKKRLLAAAESMDSDRCEAVRHLLSMEPDVIAHITARAVRKAAEEGNEAFLRELQRILDTETKPLQRTAEATIGSDDHARAAAALEEHIAHS